LGSGEGRSGEKNNTFQMVDIEHLTHEALDAVTVDDWKKCVRHAEEIQIEDNKKRNYARHHDRTNNSNHTSG